MARFHQMFALALVLVAAAQVCSAKHPLYEKVVGYIPINVNITAGPGSGTNDLSLANFSSVILFDNAITQSPDPESEVLGFYRGTGTFIGKAATKILTVSSVEFSDQSGTLLFIGSVDLSPVGVIQIVGGNGDYLFAKGLAEFETASEGVAQITIKYKKASKWY